MTHNAIARTFAAFLTAIVALSAGCTIGSASASPGARAAAGETPVAIVDMTDQPGLDPERGRSGAILGFNITNYAFDSDEDGLLDDRDTFVKLLKRKVPDDFSGFVCLDWEGPMTKWLQQPPESPNFKRAAQNLVQVLTLAKQARPRAQIGFYGVCLREYWKRDDAWRRSALATAEIFRHADWVGPSLYHMYRDSERKPADQQQYLRKNVEIALEVAELAGGKPVYLFVTHRIHPSNKKFGNELVPDDEFRQALRTMRSVRYDGRGIAGFIWWSGDQYYIKKGTIDFGPNPQQRALYIHKHYFGMLAEEAGRGS